MAIRVLVALDWRTYREAIASALQYIRPRTAVSISEAEDLDLEISNLKLHVVIHSQSNCAASEGVFCWVEILVRGEELRAVVSVRERTETIHNITLAGLVSVVDEAEALAYRVARYCRLPTTL